MLRERVWKLGEEGRQMSTNGKTARDIWTEQLEIERKQLRLYHVMREALTPLEGKVVTRRFTPVVQAHFDQVLPGVHIWYQAEYSALALGFNLHEAPADMRLDYNNTPQFRLCDKTRGRRRFTLAHFDEQNAWTALANERIAKREAVLASSAPEEIQAAAEALSQAFDAYGERVKALPDAHALDRLPMLKRDYSR